MSTSFKIQRYVWVVEHLLRVKKATVNEMGEAWKRSHLKRHEGEEFDRRTWYACFNEITTSFGIIIDVDNSTGDGIWFISNPQDIENKNIEKWMLNCLREQHLLNICLKMNNRIRIGKIAADWKMLKKVVDAMDESKKLTITYRKHNCCTSKTYTIAPYFIKNYKNRLYLLCELRRNFFLLWLSNAYWLSRKPRRNLSLMTP